MALPLPRPFSGASRQPAHARTGAPVQRVRGADGAHAVSRSSDVRGMAASIGRPCRAPSRFIRRVPAQTNFFLPLGFVPPYPLTKASKPPAGDRCAASNTDRSSLAAPRSEFNQEGQVPAARRLRVRPAQASSGRAPECRAGHRAANAPNPLRCGPAGRVLWPAPL